MLLSTYPLSSSVPLSASLPTNFANSITTSSTSATSLIKKPGKLISATCGGIVFVIIKAIAKSVSVPSVSVTSMIRNTGKRILPTCAGAVTTIKAVAHAIVVACLSGITVSKNAAHAIPLISMATVVSMMRNMGKRIATSLSSSTSFIGFAIGKYVLVSSSGSVGVTKAVSFSIATSCTSLVSMIRANGKQFFVLPVGVVTVQRAITHAISFVATIGTDLTKNTNKPIDAGSLSTSVTQSLTVGKLIVIMITAGIGASLSRVVGKFVNAGLSSVIVLHRAVGKLIVILVFALVVLVYGKLFQQLVLVTCTGVVSVTKAITHSVLAVATSSVSMVKALTHTVNVLAHGAVSTRKAITHSIVAATSSLVSVITARGYTVLILVPSNTVSVVLKRVSGITFSIVVTTVSVTLQAFILAKVARAFTTLARAYSGVVTLAREALGASTITVVSADVSEQPDPMTETNVSSTQSDTEVF